MGAESSSSDSDDEWEDNDSDDFDVSEFMSRATLFERLCDFYDAYNPNIFRTWGNGHIREIAEEYPEVEAALWIALYSKYSVPTERQIWHCCDLGEQAGLTEEEREAMVAARRAELAATPDAAALAARAAPPAKHAKRTPDVTLRLQARLTLMYNAVCPEKVADAAALAEMYHDPQEMPKLTAAVLAKYGVDLMDAAYAPTLERMGGVHRAVNAVSVLATASKARRKRRRGRPWRWARRAARMRRKRQRRKGKKVVPESAQLDLAHLAAIESTFDAEAQAREKALLLEKSKRKRMLERRLARRRRKAVAAGGDGGGLLASPTLLTAADDDTHAAIDVLTDEAVAAKVAQAKELEKQRSATLARLEKRLKIRLERL
jgi:hypothetical protein